MSQRSWTLVIGMFIVMNTISEYSTCFGQTIWEKRDSYQAFYFQDMKPRKVGDLLTILVSENTGVANSDSRALRKSSSAKAGTDFGYGGSGTGGSFDAAVDGNSDRRFNGNASFSSTRGFNDRFTVQVIDVLPNGNLLVSGKRTILVEGDTRELVLSGIVRDLDVAPDNTILSNRVANLDIKFVGEGTETKFSNQGWLARKLNRLWPF